MQGTTGCEWTCPGASLCGDIDFTTGTGGPPRPPPDVDAVRCALTALRDGTEGHVSFSVTEMPMFFSNSRTIHIRPGRVALVEGSYSRDLVSGTDRAGPVTLPAPSVFDGCLAQTDEAVWRDCLFDAAAACP